MGKYVIVELERRCACRRIILEAQGENGEAGVER